MGGRLAARIHRGFTLRWVGSSPQAWNILQGLPIGNCLNQVGVLLCHPQPFPPQFLMPARTRSAFSNRPSTIAATSPSPAKTDRAWKATSSIAATVRPSPNQSCVSSRKIPRRRFPSLAPTSPPSPSPNATLPPAKAGKPGSASIGEKKAAGEKHIALEPENLD